MIINMLIDNRHSYININHSSGKSVPNQSGWTSLTSFHPPKLWRKQPFGTGKRRTKKQLAEFHMVSSLVTSLKIAVPMLLAIWGWFLAPTFDPWRSASMDWSELNPHFSSFHAHLWGVRVRVAMSCRTHSTHQPGSADDHILGSSSKPNYEARPPVNKWLNKSL
jgi:hypothetical protein